MKKALAINCILGCLIVFFGMSCNESGPSDNATSGTIKISVDETYRPVMEEQLKVFLARYPNAHIMAEYKPEADCIQDFFRDSTRLIFITREFSKEETEYALSKQIVAKSMAMARDAIVFITSRTCSHPDFSMEELKAILSGKDSTLGFEVVFDNSHSSTVRYVSDSLLGGQKQGAKVYAAKGCTDVIDYVAENPKALGVIGVSWVADPLDSIADSFLQKVNIAGIRPAGETGDHYVKPYQAYIGLREYPCTRNFYFITKETWQGLGSGFVNYLCRDGQYVFKTSKMFPLRVNVVLRQADARK